jgi:hypothetical protein
MATTTNYSWSTPDDTALVKDGAAAIRSLGTAIDSTVFTNAGAAVGKSTVDAKGDLLVGTANDTVGRLAVGTDGFQLVADSVETTGLKWVAPTSTPTWSVIQTSAFALDKTPASIAYVGSFYLAGGQDGTLVSSSDGITWTARTFGATTNILTFATNGTIYVAAGNASLRSATDPTSTWTSRTSQISGNECRKVIYDGTQFIVVGGSTASGTKIATSTNGTTWTGRLTSSEAYYDVAYDGVGNYLAVAGDGSDRTLTSSTNGTTWTESTVAGAGTAWGVVWNGTDFVVVGTDGDESRLRIYTVTTAGVVTEKAIIVRDTETASDFDQGASISFFDNKYYILSAQGLYVGGADFRFTLVPSGFQNKTFNGAQAIAYQGGFYYGVGNAGTLMRGTGVGV